MQKGVKLGNWRINPAFLGMDEMKRQKVEDLFDALNGRNLNEALPVITNWNLQLKTRKIYNLLMKKMNYYQKSSCRNFLLNR